MYERLRRLSGAEICTWAAAAAAAAGAIVVLLVPAGHTNRVAGVALPFGVATALLVANGIAWRRLGMIGAALDGVAALALFYGIVLALSVPVRLSIEGLCQPSAKSCPVGFDYPLSNAENFAVYATLVIGAIGVALSFVAFEIKYLHRGRRRPDLSAPPAP